MADVLCVGILVADVVGKSIDGLPERGKLQLVDELELHTGGCAANTAAALARIGVPTSIVGMVGSDGFGEFMIQSLKRQGLETQWIAVSPSISTSGTMVMVHSDGERSFVHYLGANAAFTYQDIQQEALKGARILHVGGAFLMPSFDGPPTARLFQEARAQGVVTSLDTCWDSKGRWLSVIEPCLDGLDYFLPSIEEARQITGQHEPANVAQFLLDRGVKTVALKMGSDGCFIRSGECSMTLPALNVQVVDALGAGDAFAAGFLTGVLHGWDLEKTGRFANAVGALAVMSLGATTGIRSLELTLDFMNRR